MRFILGSSALSTSVPRSRRRFVFFAFEVRIWRMNACPRFTRPLAVFLKRLEAPLWVFSFGIVPLQTIQIPSEESPAGDRVKYMRLRADLTNGLSAIGIRRSATNHSSESRHSHSLP